MLDTRLWLNLGFTKSPDLQFGEANPSVSWLDLYSYEFLECPFHCLLRRHHQRILAHFSAITNPRTGVAGVPGLLPSSWNAAKSSITTWIVAVITAPLIMTFLGDQIESLTSTLLSGFAWRAMLEKPKMAMRNHDSTGVIRK